MVDQPVDDSLPPQTSSSEATGPTDPPPCAEDTGPQLASADADEARVDGPNPDASAPTELNGALDSSEIEFLASGLAGDALGEGMAMGEELSGMDPGLEGAQSQMDVLDVNGASTDVSGWSDGDNHELKRVKVYELVGSRWVDQGTAFCSGHYDDTTHEAALIARAESDYKNVILQTTIRPQDVYQRQQDTLIVWTEPNGVDYALSFQDPEGCSEVWAFIMDVQPHIRGEGPDASSPLALGPEPSLTTASIIRSGHLPRPTMGIILEIERAIKALARTAALKERVCEYIQQEEYIKQMIDTMTQAEDLENIEELHALCSLTQTILTLNDHSLFDHVLDDDIFMGVVGMLEYDPDFPAYKANYRAFLQTSTRYHSPLPISDPQIVRKVHATYRLQFLKDVVLARTIDDSTFNVLASCIMFNQVDIITYVQSDIGFLESMVSAFCEGGSRENGPLRLYLTSKPPASNGTATTSEADDERRSELVLLLQQLCAMGKNVQLPARLALFRTLVGRGALHVVQWAISRPESAPGALRLIAAGGEVLGALLDHALEQSRAHVTSQVEAARRAPPASGEPETLLFVMCWVMARSRDLAVQSLIGDALKVILEVPIPGSEIALLNPAKPNPDTVVFFQAFYGTPSFPPSASTSATNGTMPKTEPRGVIHTLFRPLDDLPEFETFTQPVLHLSREKANLYLYLCDLLCNLVVQHIFDTHRFIHEKRLVTRIATLFRVKDKHLRFAALRFFRTLVKQHDKYYRKHLVSTKVFGPILDLTLREMRRDNLISGSCLELFEHIRRENNKNYIEPIMTQFGDRVQRLAEHSTAGMQFTHFINRWKANNEELPPPTEGVPADVSPDTRTWGQGRTMDAEEEDYFLHSDEDEEQPQSQPRSPSPSAIPRLASSPVLGASGALKRRRLSKPGISAGVPSAGSAIPRPVGAVSSPSKATNAFASLGDYVDEEDEETASVSSADGAATPPPDSDVESVAETVIAATTPTRTGVGSKIPVASPVKATSPVPGSGAGLAPAAVVLSPGRPGEKRRRAEEGDDEMLERLATKSKRVSGAAAGAGEKTPTKGVGASVKKAAEEGAKRLKLKFGAAGLAVATAGASPTHQGVKDADTG